MRVGAAVKSRPLSAERVGSAEPSCAPLPTGAADAVVRAAVGSLEGASLRSASTVGVAGSPVSTRSSMLEDASVGANDGCAVRATKGGSRNKLGVTVATCSATLSAHGIALLNPHCARGGDGMDVGMGNGFPDSHRLGTGLGRLGRRLGVSVGWGDGDGSVVAGSVPGTADGVKLGLNDGDVLGALDSACNGEGEGGGGGDVHVVGSMLCASEGAALLAAAGVTGVAVVGISVIGVVVVGISVIGVVVVGISVIGIPTVGNSVIGVAVVGNSVIGVAAVGNSVIGVVIVGTPVIGVAVGVSVVGVSVVGVAVVLSPDCSVDGKQTDRGTHS